MNSPVPWLTGVLLFGTLAGMCIAQSDSRVLWFIPSFALAWLCGLPILNILLSGKWNGQ